MLLHYHAVYNQKQLSTFIITSCRRAAATICPAPLLPLWAPSASRRRADRNVAVVSHGQYVPTLTAAAA